MKRFFTKTGIWLLAAAAIIAVVLCVVSSLSSGTGLLHNALGVIASPFRSAGAAVTEWVGGIGDRFENVEALQQENEELRQQIAELEKQLRSAESAAEENRDLPELLGQLIGFGYKNVRINKALLFEEGQCLILTGYI